MDEAAIVDAAMVTSGGRTTVVMVGLSRRCICWQTFRSVDGGATWATVAAPGVRPTLAIAGARHLASCAADERGWACAGHRLTSPAALRGLPAKALDVGAGRWLLLRRYGGVLCSTDAGLTWRTRCSPAH